MSRPPIVIPCAPGTNRDQEAALAIAEAGGDPQIVLIKELRTKKAAFSDYAAVVLPGGFSYGDALGAGARLALEIRAWFWDALNEVAHSGRPILGICNGFQTLVKSGIFNEPSARRFTLTGNTNGSFECRWVTLRVEACRSSWLEPLEGTLIRCPVAHGEGRFAVTEPEVVSELDATGQVAFRYVDSDANRNNDTRGRNINADGVYPANPNGSVDDIAGLCDRTGVVVGLMPHPEDHIVDWQCPSGLEEGKGLSVFEALVAAAR